MLWNWDWYESVSGNCIRVNGVGWRWYVKCIGGLLWRFLLRGYWYCGRVFEREVF